MAKNQTKKELEKENVDIEETGEKINEDINDSDLIGENPPDIFGEEEKEIESKESEADKEKTILEGLIINCGKLRIRMNPNLKSQVVGHFKKDTIVSIDKENSTETFYSVFKDDKKGFCLKTFIKII